MLSTIKEKFLDLLSLIKENPLVDNVYSYYESLAERDKSIVKIVLIVVVFFVSFNVLFNIYSGLSNKEQELRQLTQINENLNNLNTLIRLNRQKYNQTRRDAASRRVVSLLDIIDRQQITANIKPESRIDLKETPRREVDQGRYYENTAEVKYQKITIRQLVRLLNGIEQSGASIKVSSIRIKRRYDDIRYLDSDFIVQARTVK
jgi:hypothetical protein